MTPANFRNQNEARQLFLQIQTLADNAQYQLQRGNTTHAHQTLTQIDNRTAQLRQLLARLPAPVSSLATQSVLASSS